MMIPGPFKDALLRQISRRAEIGGLQKQELYRQALNIAVGGLQKELIVVAKREPPAKSRAAYLKATKYVQELTDKVAGVKSDPGSVGDLAEQLAAIEGGAG